MKCVIFQGVNGHVATLEGLLEIEADRHVCLGNLVSGNLQDHRDREGSIQCLKLAQNQVKICEETGKDLSLLKGNNEDFYLQEAKKAKSKNRAYPELGDENVEFIRDFYTRIQSNPFRLVFLPWLDGHSAGISISDPEALNKKTDNEKRLNLLTADAVAHHFGYGMQDVIRRLFPRFGEHFVHFIGRWRLATLWELRNGLPRPKIIPPDRYKEKVSLKKVSSVLEEDRQTVVFPGSAELGYYCTYDTNSRELVIVHDSTLSY